MSLSYSNYTAPFNTSTAGLKSQPGLKFLHVTSPLRDEIKCKDANGVLPPKSRLQLTWTGDFASLKQFVCNTIKLQGIWSQRGGDKKVFSDDLFSITWRKSKKILNFDGKESNKVKRLFCMELCDAQNSTQVDQRDEPVNKCIDVHSCKCNSLSVDIEGIQLSRTSNNAKEY